MAHYFYTPPIQYTFRHADTSTNPWRRNSAPMPRPPLSQAEMNATYSVAPPSSNRNGSLSSNGEDTSPAPATDDPTGQRNGSLAGPKAPRTMSTANVRTRSIGWGAGVTFERETSPQSDEDVIIVTVRLSNKFRKSSVDGAEDLPSRPQPRSFFRRLSTRMTSNFDHSAEKEERYKAVKMPRGDYKKYFARDREGNYAGTQPERDWDEGDLERDYAVYQDLPLHSTLLMS